ncbi:membrane alanyl aminopeptidase-like [Musca vetustissima]|uniref:membrane alanyl aminopeptidase-like n=1 Tax=Musca vetustissima TaxID=27455 RepID=UPI002AB67738|nr:membrane alanyl aminopeptidase-like [Musca vetustissima]
MSRLQQFAFCLFLTLIIAGPTLSQSIVDYRLSKDVVPDFYDIKLKPYLQSEDGVKQFTFDGEVNITLHATAANVRNITLHAAMIEIVETILYDADDKAVDHYWGEDKLLYQVKFFSSLIFIFHSSDFSWYAMTQFHISDARTAFPCFDEPQIKAQFRIQITRPKDYLSYCNTQLENVVSESDGRYTDIFVPSPKMSTYLVAFLVANDFVVDGSADLKVIINQKFQNKTGFTLKVAARALQGYDQYTQMPYKTLGNGIMQMAGSNYFPHGGMENWGLIFYRDLALTQEPYYTDGWADKESTISLVVHEIGHMWFGNTVTHKWWSYFWLNEAFPTYYSHYLTQQIYPEYDMDQQFVLKQTHLIFDLDATANSQPLSHPEENINTPSEVAYKFSSIGYNKGAAILRMICNLMGRENYDNAIRDYLQENHHNSAEPDDLFKQWKRHWPKNQEVDLDQLFSDWTEQPGYPIIEISTTESGHYLIKQKRFLNNPEDGSDKSLLYTIPITYATNRENNFENLQPKFYFNRTKTEMEFGNSDKDEWIVLNLQQSNFHRVYYKAELLEKIRKALMAPKHSGVHVINRAYLLDDLFTYARLEIMNYGEVFKFIEYLSGETEYLPWQPAFKAFDLISPRLTLEQHKQFGEFLFDIMSGVYKKLGFENPGDRVLDVYNRNKVISWLCRYHHEDCNEMAQKVFKSTQPKLIPADFQETLYCAANRKGSIDIYNTLKTEFIKMELQSQKQKLLHAMGCTLHVVDNHYNFILSNEVPQSMKRSAISSLYKQTPENVDPVFQLINNTLEVLTNALGSWYNTATVVSDVANYFTTEDQLKELTEFIGTKGHLFGEDINVLENSVETVEKNLAWSSKYLASLFQYLEQRNGAAAAITNSLPILTIMIVVISYLRY